MRHYAPDVLKQTLSVVIPVYRAGPALADVVRELLLELDEVRLGPDVSVVLDEVLLVCDNPALDLPARAALAALEQVDPRVRGLWLSTNFGQHPATIAGIVSSNGDWVLTMDEDGQHDPAYAEAMLRVAVDRSVPLVYAKPSNPPPHGALRNAASRTAKRVHRGLSGSTTDFHSYRLIEGALARSACAYVGESVYLDVAMRWTCGSGAFCPVPMRAEGSASSYDLRRLASHFWRMVLSNGVRPLRIVAFGGLVVAVLGLLFAFVVAVRRITGDIEVQGWTSVMVVVLVLFGGMFVSVATLAEYVGFAVRNAIGKPLYVRADHPQSRTLWQLQAALAADVAR